MLHQSLVFVTLAALAGASPAAAQTPAFSRADYASHSGARAIATADFNRDGWPDTANANTGRDSVTILLNRGAAGSGLARAFDIAVGRGPFDIVSADFNRDGIADLAVANADADTLSVLLGDGWGNFRRTDVAAPGNPRGLTAADINRDGRIDIVYTGFRTNAVQLLLGDGAGAFTPGTGFFGSASGPQGVAAADFNNDGRMDLAVAYAGGGLVVLTMNSTGGLTARAVPGERSLNVLTTGDFNRDGWTDVAAASTDASRLGVYQGSATGLRQVATHPTGGSPRGIEAADLDNDGVLEIVTANRDANTIGVFAGRRDAPGSFAPQVQFAAGAGSRDVVATDFDNDSLVDLATGNQDQAAVTVLWNAAQLLRSGLVFSVAEEQSDEYRGSEMTLADFDHDGRLDRVTNSGYLAFGDGRRVQLPAAGYETPGVADFNRDGNLDIAFLLGYEHEVRLLFGDGRGGFSGPTTVSGGWDGDFVLTDMKVADLNRDGRPDLLVSGYAQSSLEGRLYFMPGNGNGTFAGSVVSPVEATSFIALADMDRDGRLDVLTSPSSNGGFKILILFGDGMGRFTRTSEHPTPYRPSDLVAADLNHDGRMDVVAATFQSIHVLLGTAGGLGSPATLPASSYRATVADMDGDGHPDIVANNPTSIYFGAGDGTFGPPQKFQPYSARPIVADLNRDGVPDLLLDAGRGVLAGERNETNRPPVADAGPDVTVSYARLFNDDDEYGLYVGNDDSYDPDQHFLSYEWRDADGRLLATHHGRLHVPESLLPGRYELTLRVSDGRGASDEDRMVLTILPIKEIVLHTLHDREQEVGNWWDQPDASAASGFRKYNLNSGAPKVVTAAADPADYFEVWFVADPTQEYKLWIRGKAEGNSWTNDSAWVQFDHSLAGGAPAYRIGTTSALPFNLEECAGCGISGWGWEDDGWGAVDRHGVTIRFAEGGLQRVRVQTREDGVSIDQVVLSAETYRTTRPGTAKNDTTILLERGR
jgi:hypothetical protein